MPDMKKVLKRAAFAAEILIFYALQQAPGVFPPIFGARPFLLIAAAVTIAMLEDEIPAMIFGIWAGVLMDFSMGKGLGLYAAVLAVLCFLISGFARTFLRISIASAITCGSLATIITVFIGWIFNFVFRGYSDAGFVAIGYFLPACFYTVILIPLVFYVNRGIAKSLARRY